MALRLAGALQQFWEVRGHWSEGWAFLERALAVSKGAAAPVQVKVLKAAARLAYKQSDIDRAEALYEECLAQCRELGDTAGMALSLRPLGWIAKRRYDFRLASAHAEESLALCREVRDKEGIAWSLSNLAELVSLQGEYVRAIALLEESLALFRERGDIGGIAWSLAGLATLLIISSGDQATGRALLEESLALCREVGHKEGIAGSLGLLGQVALRQGDVVKAHALLEEGIVLSREIGNQNIAWLLIVLGRVVACQGNHAAARTLYEESRSLTWEIGIEGLLAPYLEGLADMVMTQGDLAWAARLWGLAEARREAMGAPLSPIERTSYEHVVTAARTQLGEKTFAAAWAQGRRMTPLQVLVPPGPATISPLASAVSSLPPPATSSPSASAELTRRELEVLRLLARGVTDAQIAEQLVLSLNTVHAHLRSIYSKLGVTSRSAATRYAFEHQLV